MMISEYNPGLQYLFLCMTTLYDYVPDLTIFVSQIPHKNCAFLFTSQK